MLKALMKGVSLSNPCVWKKAQNIVNLAAGTTPFLAVFYPPLGDVLTVDFYAKLLGALAVWNGYFTTATSEKIGL